MLMAAVLMLGSCSESSKVEEPQGEEPVVSIDVPQEGFFIEVGEELVITPRVQNTDASTTYLWLLNGEEYSTEKTIIFSTNSSGEYGFLFKATNAYGSDQESFKVDVLDSSIPPGGNNSAYISEVVAYNPAPGQFINEVIGTPQAAQGLVGPPKNTLSLGAFGGHVIFKFDHALLNQPDADDLVIYGNSFEDSAEPGAVMVCEDEVLTENSVWYELKGSMYDDPATIHDFSITYYKPTEDPLMVNSTEGLLDWSPVAAFHDDVYPAWEGDEISFSGTMIPSNSTNDGDAQFPVYEGGGYADNQGYTRDGVLKQGDLFDLDDAVDSEGNPVNLEQVHHIMVYTCTLDINGVIGERSTEVRGAADLSFLE